MGQQTFRADRFKLGLSIFWFVFTFSMVTWWWIFSLRQLETISSELPAEKFMSLRRMLLWEGSILLTLIFGGGLSLLILTNRERLRNLRLRLFFSNFSHDLKTSLSRLRLRAEVLGEREASPQLHKLMEEVNRLDLQLENSLWVARGEEQQLLQQKFFLSDIISSLRVEWPEMEIHLQKNSELRADQQAFKSVIRNLLQNSWLHGQATRIDIQVSPLGSSRVQICIQDNGKGMNGDFKKLGRGFLPSQERQGNGLGLYLTQSLLQRMDGEIAFAPRSPGFEVQVKIPGAVTG